MPDYDRFRSFAERYVVARAVHFRAGKEKEDGWNATLDAITLYKNIEKQALVVDPPAQFGVATGVTGAQGVGQMINTYQGSQAQMARAFNTGKGRITP